MVVEYALLMEIAAAETAPATDDESASYTAASSLHQKWRACAAITALKRQSRTAKDKTSTPSAG